MISALQVVTPPAVEPVTVDFARRHMRIDNDGDDDLLGFYLASARASAETYLARALITQTLRWTIAEASPNGGWPLASLPVTLLVFPQWVTPGMLGRGALNLPRLPAQSIVSATLADQAGNDTSLDPSALTANLGTGQLRLAGVSGLAPGGSLAIEYVAGYGDAPADVPVPIVNAILLAATALYEHRGDDDGEMPKAAEALLTPYRLVTFGS